MHGVGIGGRVHGDGSDAHGIADRSNRGNHGLVDPIRHQVLDEVAVDLQIIHGQVLEIGERGQAATEVVKGELAAAFPLSFC